MADKWSVSCGWRSPFLMVWTFLTGQLECPPNMAAGFPQSVWSGREQGGRHNAFYDLVSEVTLSFPQYPIGYTVQVYSVFEGTPSGCDYQEVTTIRAILEAYHHRHKVPLNKKRNALKSIMSSCRKAGSHVFRSFFTKKGRRKAGQIGCLLYDFARQLAVVTETMGWEECWAQIGNWLMMSAMGTGLKAGDTDAPLSLWLTMARLSRGHGGSQTWQQATSTGLIMTQGAVTRPYHQTGVEVILPWYSGPWRFQIHNHMERRNRNLPRSH